MTEGDRLEIAHSGDLCLDNEQFATITNRTSIDDIVPSLSSPEN